jgi:two-component system, NarL family, nitrate/nitrite response regulator NarL
MHIDSSSQAPILVVDDDRAFGELMVELLAPAGYRGVAVRTAGEALERARSEVPLLVVLDVFLPDLSGYEALQQLRAALGEQLPVLLISGVRVEAYDRAAGLLCGADDYLVKPFAADEFLARVRALLRRTSVVAQPEIQLTEREAEVLALLATGLEPADVAEQLGIGVRTVGTHLEHMMDKLGAHSRGQMIALAYQQGLVAPAAEPMANASRLRPGATVDS